MSRHTGLISLPPEVIHWLRTLPERPDAESLRSAGDAGGATLFRGFQASASEDTSPMDMAIQDFNGKAGAYLGDSGWGHVEITQSDALIEVAIAGCWEATADRASGGCHITTGLLHGFFVELAGYDIAAMEVECGAHAGGACRFAIGTPEMMQVIYEGLSAGEKYEEIKLRGAKLPATS